MADFIHQYFSELAALLGIIVWLIRIEHKVAQVEKLAEMHASLLTKLSEIAERLAHIEGKLGVDERR